MYFNRIRTYFFWRKFWPKCQQNYYRHMEKKKGEKIHKNSNLSSRNAHVSVILAALIKQLVQPWPLQTELLTSALSHDWEQKPPQPPLCGSEHAQNPKPVFSLAEPRTSLPSGAA